MFLFKTFLNIQKSQFLKKFQNRCQFTASRETEEPPYDELTRDFLNPKDFYDLLQQNDITFYTGVPDSLLEDFCAYVTDKCDPKNHIITANEGSALATAAGYHLATNKVPLVYLQNSGLGWRGEPGKKDEPQHLVQGQTMNSLITEMGIQFEVLPDFIEGATEAIESAIQHAKKRKHLMLQQLKGNAHDSVGGQPTAASNVDFCKLALSLGYNNAYLVQNENQLSEIIQKQDTKMGQYQLKFK
ncbi:phosphonopyruvate decarboxylase, putative [Ichthyophthirius multifiliis]|uniref:Phosphonopyruvate decarboxylase, putative n=1 Tax=Ichthyophthirius multifiliis TaxID=5932 RepID=G0QVR1_ICHMU|nr:phosphonopyruvate decarboxylase, putative [Ichthyophthirius multifiliis]EGR30694.1 phosphonopyruvate decarboxylase, putative [Ichthyophthirius multifiliis]|eukprot:XP_004032281.1 phosphonopyruvate decarboxylase, putative [Ichthyophthirius multifiliis]